MNLRKTKVSIVTNAIFVLVASLFCILAIMDAAKQFGFSYLPGLIAFGVFAVLGLVLWKVFSLCASSDQVKAIYEKGDTLGLLVFAVLIIASIIFRVASYGWNGLGGNIYFDLAKVTGGEFTHYVHACDDWYIAGLHAVFFLFGNRIFVAAIFNCVLQLASVILGFFAFRKMLGIVPALFFTGFWTITGFSVHEALTLNSRNLVFLLMMLAFFAISTCVPATGGKFICYLVSGIITAVCIYADIIGVVLLPFIVGIVLNDLTDEDTDPGLRFRKMLFTLISVIFGLVLIVFLDSYLSSTNPSEVLNSVLSLYAPSEGFSFGFSYLTSYIEVTIIAVIVTIGLFTCFLAEYDSKTVLLLSVVTVTLINNFGLTYLENDGREIFFAFAALFAGTAFRELFPDQIQGNIFKASSELYDNEFTAPDKGYVPAGVKSGSDLSSEDFGDIGDGMTYTSVIPPAEKKPEDPAQSTQAQTASGTPAVGNGAAPETPKTEEKKEDAFEYPAFDSAPIARAHAAQPQALQPAQHDESQTVHSSTLSGPTTISAAQTSVPRVHLSEAALAAKAARDAETAAGEAKQDASVKSEAKTAEVTAPSADAVNKTEEKQPERPQTYSTYTYQKPQLRPEFRRRPGAWAQSYMEKKQDKPATESKSEDMKEDKPSDVTAKKAPEVQRVNAEEKKPEIAPNGAVLLDNPIPHPARKTEHKNMEYDVNVDDSSLHFDINISDNDDYDV
ncbi:MAG: hypothetical protein K6F65_04285 [Lachnospiraceae bacterium]|nr:hypothetical protein [Lachnospiraceae bacterium]